MELSQYMKSIIDMERASVVICGLDHTILYLNPAAAKNYGAYGGKALEGKSLMACHNGESRKMIEKVVAWFGESTQNNMIHTFYEEKQNKDGYMVALRDEDGKLIGYYEKHEYRSRETAPFYDFSRSLR
ncbi:MAG: PAS domain-containing protein [Lachnospiraceae bacterium]|nr:PAS domain-containing protein [Lachnospiraceae bacterium]